MNAIYLNHLAQERIAEYRRQADQARLFAPTTAQSPSPAANDIEPRIPRRGPLQVFGGLRSLLRAVFA